MYYEKKIPHKSNFICFRLDVSACFQVAHLHSCGLTVWTDQDQTMFYTV